MQRVAAGMRFFVVVLAVLSACFSATAAARDSPRAVRLQDAFDHLGPVSHALRLRDGRIAHYVDEGRRGWRPVVFLGGTGTSARALELTEFLRSSRESLRLRMISVERNGFGETGYDPRLGFDDYSSDVLAVLDRLRIRRFAVVAISGGGPYAAHLAARAPGRVISLHLAAAEPPYGPTPPYCPLTDAALGGGSLGQLIKNPMAWWAFPASSPVNRIPGFLDAAYDDGARTFFVRGQLADPAPIVHEWRLYCSRPGPDLSRLRAPSYLYFGTSDQTVPIASLSLWRSALGRVAAARVYPGEGHDVQYRHWDQVLLDLAGYGRYTAVCARGHTQVVPAGRVSRLRRRGATLGVCAWRR